MSTRTDYAVVPTTEAEVPGQGAPPAQDEGTHRPLLRIILWLSALLIIGHVAYVHANKVADEQATLANTLQTAVERLKQSQILLDQLSSAVERLRQTKLSPEARPVVVVPPHVSEALPSPTSLPSTSKSPSSPPSPSRPPAPVVPETPTAVVQKPKLTKCDRDVGPAFFDRYKEAERVICSKGGQPVARYTQINLNTPISPPGWEWSRFTPLTIDMMSPPIEIVKPIPNCESDGGNHDPRFDEFANNLHCSCDSGFSGTDASHLFAWPAKSSVGGHCNSREIPEPDVTFDTPVFAMTRRDDHNPFFMTSIALNAWVIAKQRNMSLNDVTMIAFDHADFCWFPINDIFPKLTGKPLVLGWEMRGKKMHFKDITFLPSEYDGLIMQELNTKAWACKLSPIVSMFASHIAGLYGVENVRSNPDKITVTIISRPATNKDGRHLSRILTNEREVLEAMQGAGDNIEVFSREFTEVAFGDQVKYMRQTDLIVGMHGAGMANIMWALPGTTVIEIFPRAKRRYSFRHISAYVGALYYEYRGGRDSMPFERKEVNAADFACFIREESACLLERKRMVLAGNFEADNMSGGCQVKEKCGFQT